MPALNFQAARTQYGTVAMDCIWASQPAATVEIGFALTLGFVGHPRDGRPMIWSMICVRAGSQPAWHAVHGHICTFLPFLSQFLDFLVFSFSTQFLEELDCACAEHKSACPPNRCFLFSKDAVHPLLIIKNLRQPWHYVVVSLQLTETHWWHMCSTNVDKHVLHTT